MLLFPHDTWNGTRFRWFFEASQITSEYECVDNDNALAPYTFTFTFTFTFRFITHFMLIFVSLKLPTNRTNGTQYRDMMSRLFRLQISCKMLTFVHCMKWIHLARIRRVEWMQSFKFEVHLKFDYIAQCMLYVHQSFWKSGSATHEVLGYSLFGLVTCSNK